MTDDTFDPRARRRHAVARLLLVPLALAALGMVAWAWVIRMPGASHRGALPALTEAQRALAGALRRDVTHLAEVIGERNTATPGGLRAAATYLEDELRASGHPVRATPFEAGGVTCLNLAAERRGTGAPDEVVVVGAHYDSARGSPGANDNATGVAAVLALARAVGPVASARTVRFELWPNEEPPWFQRPGMGSLVAAAEVAARGERVVAMLSLETLGFYSDTPGSQRYPAPFEAFYPTTGDFVAFVGNAESRGLVHRLVADFRHTVAFPCEGAAAPASMPGIGWSDHWAYWQHGYPAVMVTDTAPYRYRHYHTRSDLPEHVDFERLARVVDGLRGVIERLASE